MYLAHCTPLADATSYDDRVQLTPANAIRSTTATGVDYTLDTGYRPSLPTLALQAFGVDTRTVAWIRPELKERSAPGAGTPPPPPRARLAAPGLGPGVYAGPAPPNGVARDGEQPIEQTAAKTPTIAALAKRLQPTVLTSVTDPFWPLSLGALLEDLASSGRRPCVHRRGSHRPCAPGVPTTVADLDPRTNAPNDFLEYPVTPPSPTNRPSNSKRSYAANSDAKPRSPLRAKRSPTPACSIRGRPRRCTSTTRAPRPS